MIKTGITKLNQLSNDKTFLRKELKNISINLYDQTLNFVDGDQLAERILLFFSDERGAYKRNYQKRFEAFDLAMSAFFGRNNTATSISGLTVIAFIPNKLYKLCTGWNIGGNGKFAFDFSAMICNKWHNFSYSIIAKFRYHFTAAFTSITQCHLLCLLILKRINPIKTLSSY